MPRPKRHATPARHHRRIASVVATAVMLTAISFTAGSVAPATAATPEVTVTPTSGLVDGQTITLYATGLPAGATAAVVECGPAALAIKAGSGPHGDTNAPDGCDAQSALIRFTGDGATMNASIEVHTILNAAVGPIDCRVEQCFVALFPIAGGAPLSLQNLTFAASACAAPGSCRSGTRPGIAGASAPRPARATPAPSVVATATVGSPVTLNVAAGLAGDLSATGAITGEVTGPFTPAAPPATPVTGQGIVRLMLAAPGTDWGANTPSSVVADVSVDGGATQQIVLFNGATPFVYAGGLGTLTSGPHTVKVAVDAAQSVPGSGPASIRIHDVELLVADASNPRYDTLRYAPIVWGRSTSALHDTPLVEYGSTSPSGGGTTSSYTLTFSHEDTGTAFIPFLESSVWGRMTDIESFFTMTADSSGTPTSGTFLSGATPDDYPDTLNAIAEPTDTYTTGVWDQGTHGVLRVATGNNDFSQNGTTAFRFRPVPVPAPGPGQPREAVMDTNPWTYRISGEEVARWYTNFTTDPSAPEQGDVRQYAYVQFDTTGTGVDHLAVDIRLAGDDTWYANDFGSGYDTGGTGLHRTVIKLPLDWESHPISEVRIRVFPPGAAGSVKVTGLSVFALDGDWGFHSVAIPAPQVVGGFLFVTAKPVPVPPRPPSQPASSQPAPPGAPPGDAVSSGAAHPIVAEPTFTG